jgi:protocatechuate 3,4-dioxygenase beta subunit
MKNQERFDSNILRVASVALIVVWMAVAALAQESRGTIIGRVADTTGATLPGVKIDITNAATNVTATATTNEEGRFSAPFLLPGAYRVTVEKDRIQTLRANWRRSPRQRNR